MWDFRESPLVDGDKVICTPGGEETTMVALNKLTGETIWKSLCAGPWNRRRDRKIRGSGGESPEHDANRSRALNSRHRSQQRDFS